ncbi:MAG: SBBP repeat-containing protein, partial [Thermodesulfobacteriota bacterium]
MKTLKITFVSLLSLLLFLGFLGLGSSYGAATSADKKAELKSEIKPDLKKDVDPAAKAKVTKAYGKLPLYFIKNDGQVDAKVEYYVKGAGYTIYFTHEGVYFSLYKTAKPEERPGELKETEKEAKTEEAKKVATPEKTEKTEESKSEFFNLSLVDSNKKAKIIGEEKQAGKVNYFVGSDKSKWRSNVPTFAAVLYEEVYKGIDVRFYGKGRLLEYDVIVKPGADPNLVKFVYDGIKGLRLSEEGELQIGLKEALLVQKKPFIYQNIDGKKVEVEGKFIIEDDTTYGFKVASYDKTKELVIDPTLDYSTYLGGAGNPNYGRDIAVDSLGNAYVIGYTKAVAFPTTASAYQGSNAGGVDVFVTKMNAAGSALVYSTYLGGSSTEYGFSIAVDSSGAAYVTGHTYSANFPTASAIDGTLSGTFDAFVTKLNAAGSALEYSTFLGGTGGEGAKSIAVDSSGNAYVTGDTSSTNFPTVLPIYPNLDTGWDAYVTKINAAGSALIYSTYLGGNGSDTGWGIAVDSSGAAYVAGLTSSSDFPTVSAIYGDNTGTDAFVTKINAGGSALTYSTYLGGSLTDYANGIAIDSSGASYVVGMTSSSDFPTVSAIYGTKSTSYDTFVAKIDSAGSALIYSTYLGGNGDDRGYAIDIDSSGAAYVMGQTSSTNYPTVSAYQGTYGGGSWDVFVSRIDSAGSALTYSTFLGGSGIDDGRSIAVDSSGAAYITGDTGSSGFPTVSAYDGTNSGYDAFIAKISLPFIDTTSLSFGIKDTAYAGYVMTSGGDGSYTFSISSGTLPVGLGLNTSTGLISGTPTVLGAAVFTIQVVDGNGDTDDQGYSITVYNSTVLDYSTYLGGTDNETALSIAVDSSGAVYLTGDVMSTNFPTVNALYGTYAGGMSDAFLVKLNSAGTALVYSTYFGGSDDDAGQEIAVDGAGAAYVTGSTMSTDFPTVSAIYGSYGGGSWDAFVIKINAAGSVLTYSTYLGGTGEDRGRDIAVDQMGAAYVTGNTYSTDFPTASAIDSTCGGCGASTDVFVTKVNAEGSALTYSTFLGGANFDYGMGIAVDQVGSAYVTGQTDSTDFPTVSAIYGSNSGSDDAFVLKIDTAGSALDYSTYLGGTVADQGTAIAVDSSGAAYVTGFTYSTDFPTASAIDSTCGGCTTYNDAFMTKVN